MMLSLEKAFPSLQSLFFRVFNCELYELHSSSVESRVRVDINSKSRATEFGIVEPIVVERDVTKLD